MPIPDEVTPPADHAPDAATASRQPETNATSEEESVTKAEDGLEKNDINQPIVNLRRPAQPS